MHTYRNVRQVTNLPAPARFRATISYRWLDAQGRVVRQATRLTPVCVQPDERPLLVVARVSITPSPSSLDAQYAITLGNDGRGPAGPFPVALTVNGMPQPDLVVQSLAAGTPRGAGSRRSALHARELGDGHDRPAEHDQRGARRRAAQDGRVPPGRRVVASPQRSARRLARAR